jgi:hypothetical protein
VDVENTVLVMNIGTDDGGKITISIPRYILNSQLMDTDIPFEIAIDGKSVEYQESTNPNNDRVVSVNVAPGSESLTITGSVIYEEAREPIQTLATPPIMQEPSLSKGYEIICEGKVWIENLKGKIACTLPSTAKNCKEISRAWMGNNTGVDYE